MRHNVGRTYGLKGKTPIVKHTGNRFLCNMISAIINIGKLSFMNFDENFTEDFFLKFLKRSIRQQIERCFLIVDNHRSHKSKKVNTWLRINEEKIRIYYLPSNYAELNPDEFFNQDVESYLGKQRLHNRSKMVKTLHSHLKSRQKSLISFTTFLGGVIFDMLLKIV